MGNYWFISDTHFSHTNIIKYCNRPFKNVFHMNRELVKRFNERVKEDDTCFHLGDWGFKKSKEAPRGNNFEYYRKQLKCKNIICIKGSHDSNNGNKTIIESLVIRYGNKWIKLVHSPDAQYIDTRYDLIFCGHVHNNWKVKRIRQGYSYVDVINLSVDVWDFRPVSFNEVMHRYSQWLKEGV